MLAMRQYSTHTPFVGEENANQRDSCRHSVQPSLLGQMLMQEVRRSANHQVVSPGEDRKWQDRTAVLNILRARRDTPNVKHYLKV